ncbi:MAG: hypothetical protein QXR84_07365 [Candidatus Bathyarchaeia archaeon]
MVLTIYIEADGSITPTYAPIVISDKKNLRSHNDIIARGGRIVIERSNIILDG